MDPDFYDKYLMYMAMGSAQLFGIICACLLAVALGFVKPHEEITISLAVSILSGQAIGGLITRWVISLRRT